MDNHYPWNSTFTHKEFVYEPETIEDGNLENTINATGHFGELNFELYDNGAVRTFITIDGKEYESTGTWWDNDEMERSEGDNIISLNVYPNEDNIDGIYLTIYEKNGEYTCEGSMTTII